MVSPHVTDMEQIISLWPPYPITLSRRLSIDRRSTLHWTCVVLQLHLKRLPPPLSALS